MFTRSDTIARLTTITDVIAEDLADETADRQMTLENVQRYLSTLTRRLELDEKRDAEDAKTIAGGLELLLDLIIPSPAKSGAKCAVCGGCPAGSDCIGAFILDDHKACTCTPVAAQTSN